MLLSLHIKNYALIDDLHVEFGPGLNIFTGETGAGKSIIIESTNLVLGERASTQVIKKDAAKCLITAEFDISKLPGLKRYVSDSGLAAAGDDALFIRRELDASGKSRAFVNDSPVGLNALAAIGDYLVDVHGQHEHQSLIKTAYQRALVDSFGNLEAQKEKVKEKYTLWKQLDDQQRSQGISEEEKERRLELYGFQIKEIEGAHLNPGEEEEIEQLLPQLKNVEKLRELSEEAKAILSNEESSLIGKLSKVQKNVEGINALCGSLADTLANLQSAYFQVEEVEKDLESFADDLHADPEKLNMLLTRQEAIHRLKKKYGATIPDILAYFDKISAEVALLSRMSQNKQELEEKISKAHKELLSLCAKLSELRQKAAHELARQVARELAEVGMKKAHLHIAVEKMTEPTSEGMDTITFMFSANAGQDPKPLKDIASGGEMSRVMLALKTVCAKADKVPVLVFDEIDSGIGGPMGQTVGKKLKNLSKNHQILCITHLPQIAAFADKHFSVRKEQVGAQAITAVTSLSDKGHIEEISRMLSGEEVTLTARKHAQELVKQSQ